MVMLISLQQASDQLRRDTTEDDPRLNLHISAASAVVVGLMGDAVDFLDSNGDVEQGNDGNPSGVPAHVQQATLLLTEVFYDGKLLEDYMPAVNSLLNIAGRVPRLA